MQFALKPFAAGNTRSSAQKDIDDDIFGDNFLKNLQIFSFSRDRGACMFITILVKKKKIFSWHVAP